MVELYEGTFELAKAWVSCLERITTDYQPIPLHDLVIKSLEEVGFFKGDEDYDEIGLTFTLFMEICHTCMQDNFKPEYKFVIVYIIFDLLFTNDCVQAELNKAMALFGITGKEVSLFSAIWLLFNQIPGIHPDIYFENLVSDQIPKCIEKDVKEQMKEIIGPLRPESSVAMSRAIYDKFLAK
ncbi:hypothetical protein TVAG_066820 [Trichomonas vaginalis G3]|uniref:Uncharacterized protein n=1 Tax=Trichomonas vaginalis (strain ATCC PRA-98 / G3) TaxID=412133 RepID=A2DS98_TRIV3|nr:hypothetical protein TVAGG3_0078850 [Trichomonas vaginalis G3]EAY16677.1 hypothetical protein TVAG_066820 [Trichomonas vaginalis G3]KAI5543099.1 hypothetical protein TVAGG3_0078850 [Trichomonas vaginalis G3]|eukprot:XP_001328900.1 hypothetical protein [Trichomonas vaginalis G3]